MLKFLLEKGLDPNLQNSGGFTAMHFAVWQMQKGRHEWNEPRIRCVKLLMDNGANPKLKAGKNNQSPIQQAITKGLDNVVEILLK
jgi:ankyrin repeat protein